LDWPDLVPLDFFLPVRKAGWGATCFFRRIE